MIRGRFTILAFATVLLFILATSLPVAGRDPKEEGSVSGPIKLGVKPIASDPSVKYDYDIVYVRAPRHGDNQQALWPEVYIPMQAEPGSDLMLLHPDGRQEVLVAAGQDSVTDPFVSFDGQWVYYVLIHNVRRPSPGPLAQSSDIFKIHVKSRKIVQLTHQEFTPNSGIAEPGMRLTGAYNMGPCPLPGGKVMFTSNRNGLVPTKGYSNFAVNKETFVPGTTLQLFVMDDDGNNVEQVGHLNINGALHPTILRDGRVMFASFESEGLRDLRTWAVWTIHPDGTQWFPLFSAMGASGETARHFMTQLSDGQIIVEEYYFQRSMGFGTFYKMAENTPEGEPYFGSAASADRRNIKLVKEPRGVVPFSPHGAEELTLFSHFSSSPAYLSDPKDPKSPRAGKVTQPSGAPDNNLLTVYSSGPVFGVSLKDPGHEFVAPAVQSGIYMIKGGKPVNEPAEMLLIKDDPNYNEQWPRALVPYKRIYGIDEPARLAPLANYGKESKELPEGSPFGMVGSSSLYKRESYPGGAVAPGSVTAHYAGGDDPYQELGILAWRGVLGNWFNQGAEDGKYDNSDIHAIRVLVTEPTTDPRLTKEGTRRWWNASNERLRILGEIPVRKFHGDIQPIDPDGNPDTSFLVKLPADVAWTFQTLDKNGMVLNMAQTWHQVRPGEIRTDCGGCHAHSQARTPWEATAAAKADYPVFDLTRQTPLLTTKKLDESHKKWDVNDETGLRFEKSVKNVEFFRDVKPILDRSCIACHTQKWTKPAGNLVMDDDKRIQVTDNLFSLLLGRDIPELPGTYMRLALDQHGQFGNKSNLGFPGDPNMWAHPQGSRYIRYFQSRRSLLAWKIFGKRLDGFRNDDFAYETTPGDISTLQYKGKPMARPNPRDFNGSIRLVNLAYTGTIMPPPEAVAGTYEGPDGRKIKVPPLSDEDRFTIVRWIDLGCPIDFDFDPKQPKAQGRGWLADDNRPTLTLTTPLAGANTGLKHILVGMQDYESGLDMSTFQVIANFNLAGVNAGENLASRFKSTSRGVWEMHLALPVTELRHGRLVVSVKDKQGNLSRIERDFSVGRREQAASSRLTVSGR